MAVAVGAIFELPVGTYCVSPSIKYVARLYLYIILQKCGTVSTGYSKPRKKFQMKINFSDLTLRIAVMMAAGMSSARSITLNNAMIVYDIKSVVLVLKRTI